MGKLKSVMTILGATLASGATVITTNQVVEQYNYNNIHEITTTDTYYINGEEVSEEEFDAAKSNVQVTTNKATTNNAYTYSGVTFGDYDYYYSSMLTEGTTFEWLAVDNASNNTAGGCYDSYVYSSNSNGYRVGQGNDYLNLSCIYRVEDDNYEDYRANCASRTSPGNYNGKGGWSRNSTAQMATYYLKNAKVEIVNKTTTTYGGKPLYQIIISYDWAYSSSELTTYLTKGE